MAKRILFCFFLILILLNHNGQRPAVTVNYRQPFNQAEQLFNAAAPTAASDSLALDAYKKVIVLLVSNRVNDSVLITSLIRSGVLNITYQKDSAALDDFLISIAVQQHNSSLPDSALFQSYLFSGSIYYRRYYFDSAFYYYRKAKTIIEAHPNTKESARLYNMMGALFYQTGDYKKCIQYFEKALSLNDPIQAEHVFFEVNYKNNIASALRKLHQYTQALQVYKKLLDYHINTTEILHNIGVTYLENDEPRQAIYYLSQVEYNNQVKYNDLSKAYIKLARYDSARLYIEKAHSASNSQFKSKKNIDLAITYLNEGNLNKAQGDSKAALQNFHSALQQVDNDFNDNHVTKNPSKFTGLHNSYLLFEILTDKANCFVQLYEEHRQVEHLKSAFNTYTSALTLAGQVEKNFHSDEARFFLEENAANVYRQAVQTSLQLYEVTNENTYLNSAFVFTENSKASVLQTEMHELELNDMNGLPVQLIQQQTALKAAALKLAVKLQESTDSVVIQGLKNKIRDNDIQLSTLQDKLEDDPGYYQSKYNSRQIDVPAIQQQVLTKNAALLSYYNFNNRVICFYITRDDFGYTSTVVSANWVNEVKNLAQQLNAGANADQKKISTISGLLYNTLIAPVIKRIGSKNRLLIIPYNELSFVPFEILSPVNNDQILLKHFAISYNYSANFLFADDTRISNYKALAMAPFAATDTDETLSPLLYSSTEIEGLKGVSFINQQATKKHFIDNYKNFPIVHFATHAIVNDTFPLQSYIAFYRPKGSAATSGKLYEQEIYQLNMKHTKLVILSACETGSGQLVNEEGIISLSRAFSYAGCKSVVTSLWKADDAATAFIVKKLHHYLSKGYTKDEALQKAKTDYLKSSKVEARFKTPVYWAHLVLIGNNQSIVTDYSTIYTGLIALVLVTLTAAFFIKKNRMQKYAYGTKI